MRNSKKIITAIALVITLIGYYLEKQASEKNIPVITEENTSSRNEQFDFFPSSTTNQIVHHNYYSLSYSEEHEQAEWVAYALHKKDIAYTNFKRPFFVSDPNVRTTSASWKNYKRSGYDKGHLCPAGDRKFSLKAFDETFYTSNITPQKHKFNAGIWNKLEQKTRYWAKKYKHLYVVTGGVLDANPLKTIGKERVTVPHAFYKVLLDYTKPEIKVIAFLIPHKESKKPLSDFVISIDELEKITKLDFFPNLPNDIENKLEASVNYKKWAF